MDRTIYAKEVESKRYLVGDRLVLNNGEEVEFLAEIRVKELRSEWHLGCMPNAIEHNGLTGYAYRYNMYRVINSDGKIENIAIHEFNESSSWWKNNVEETESVKVVTPDLPFPDSLN